MNKTKIGALVCICFLLFSCNPDSIEMEIYTSDIQVAMSRIVEIPATVSFNIYSDDNDSTQSTIEIAKKYLGKDVEIKTSKADYGKNIIVKCKIPMSTQQIIDKNNKNNMSPFALIIDGSKVTFAKTNTLDEMNNEISSNNMMISIDMPSKKTMIRIIGDSANPASVSAVAVFVDDKPELQFACNIEKRSSIQMLFNGDSSSVYSEIPPQFTIDFKK